VNLWLLSSSQRSPRVVQMWLSARLPRAEFEKVQTDFLWKSRWKTICLKPLQKPFPWCTLLAEKGVLKIQTTSEQFSIFTQNSLKYSRHTKFFDLACVTVTQIDRSCRRCQSLPTLSLSFQGLLKSSHHSWLSHMGKWSSLSECKMKLEK